MKEYMRKRDHNLDLSANSYSYIVRERERDRKREREREISGLQQMLKESERKNITEFTPLGV